MAGLIARIKESRRRRRLIDGSIPDPDDFEKPTQNNEEVKGVMPPINEDAAPDEVAVYNTPPPTTTTSGGTAAATTINGSGGDEAAPDEYKTTDTSAIGNTVTTVDGDNDLAPDEYRTPSTVVSADGQGGAKTEVPSLWSMSYADAIKQQKNITPQQWLYETSKYRRENGLDPLSYEEIGLVASSGKDIGKSEEERKKEEKRLYGAELFNSLGGFLANLVNYGRTRQGHAAMNLAEVGKAGQERINKIREYRDKLAKANYDDYIANVARDRAESARRETLQASREAQQTKTEQWLKEYELKKNKIDNDAKLKTWELTLKDNWNNMNYDQKERAMKIREQYQNRMAGAAERRAANSGSDNNTVRETVTIPKVGTFTRKSTLSQLEARDLVNAFGTDEQKAAISSQWSYGSTPDYVGYASQVIQSGAVPEDELIARGFVKSKAAASENLLPGRESSTYGSLLP
jgi:hypothetical protein